MNSSSSHPSSGSSPSSLFSAGSTGTFITIIKPLARALTRPPSLASARSSSSASSRTTSSGSTSLGIHRWIRCSSLSVGGCSTSPHASTAVPRSSAWPPQRQENQRASPSTEAAINSLLKRKAVQNPATLVMEKSFFEPHLRALKRRLPAGAVAGAPGTAAEWGGEIAHAHYESSAHVVLHPADAAELIRAGWGERHPLACCAEHWLWRFYHHSWRGVRLPLPNNFVLVYAPRNQAEMAVFERIVNAAIWFHALHRGGENAEPANTWTPPVHSFSPPGPTAPNPNSA